MKIDEAMLSRLIAKAAREIEEERAAAERTKPVNNEYEYTGVFSAKDLPLIENCKPCSQRYWAQRRQNS